MLWSLLKILFFVALIAGLTYGATILIETDEPIRIAVAGVEYTLSPMAAVVAALLLLGATWLVFKIAGFLIALIRFLNGDETAISRYFTRNREKRGFKALADGMVALASGEGRLAMTKATQAERYLARPDLTNILTAQAAEMTGDKTRATQAYKAMLSDDRSRFVGVRGLLKQKLAEGDTETALKLAEKAFALKPRNAEAQDVLLRLQAGDEDWAGARHTLAAKLKSGGLPRDLHKRRDAVLAYAEAREVGDTDAGKRKALEANRLSPTLVPAAALAARVQVSQGKQRQAVKTLKRAWTEAPHPELAAAFAEIAPNETPTERIKRFAPFLALRPDHPETRLLESELYLAAEDFPAARKALGDLYETAPTARSLTLMAAIERGSGADDATVRAWLARAVTATRGEQWVCASCNHIHGDWRPICASCGAFDSLSWTVPPQEEAGLGASAGLLPLILGAIEDKSSETAPAEDPVAPEETAAEVEAPAAPAEEIVPEAEPGDTTSAEVIDLEVVADGAEAPPENRASAS